MVTHGEHHHMCTDSYWVMTSAWMAFQKFFVFTCPARKAAGVTTESQDGCLLARVHHSPQLLSSIVIEEGYLCKVIGDVPRSQAEQLIGLSDVVKTLADCSLEQAAAATTWQHELQAAETVLAICRYQAPTTIPCGSQRCRSCIMCC